VTVGPPDRLPTGFSVRIAPTVRVRDDGRTLIGGDRAAVLHLKPPAAGLVAEDGTVTVHDAATATLCRLLLDRGFGVPWWPGAAGGDDEVDDVTVVVPVRDRPRLLARLLSHLPSETPVIVVDDGSRDRAACAREAARAGATLLTHLEGRGPAAARNTGLAAVTTGLVAFIDSDVVPRAGWLAGLRRHFDDPAVALVAPRVLGLTSERGDGWIARYEAARSSLDLGPMPGGVRPHARVSYVPAACMMARTTALGDGFDADLQVAEDVDLVWRLVGSGWRVRYAPEQVVRHEHRTAMWDWLGRKAYYGTGASLLAERHGTAVAPMVLTSWTAAFSIALLVQRRWSVPLAAAVYGILVGRIRGRLGHSGNPLRTAGLLAGLGVHAALRQTAAALVRHHWPVAVVAALRWPRARRALVAAAVTDALLDFRATDPDLDPLRYALARRLDDLAYGAGLWAGAVRSRSIAALVPTVRGLGAARRVDDTAGLCAVRPARDNARDL
jgi:mycofactocin system glycosyltransferase